MVKDPPPPAPGVPIKACWLCGRPCLEADGAVTELLIGGLLYPRWLCPGCQAAAAAKIDRFEGVYRNGRSPH